MITTEYTIELRMEKSIQRITQPICVRINENETQCVRAKLMYENSPYEVQCDSAELHLLRDDGTWSHMEASVSGSSVTCTIKANQLGKQAQNACAYFFFKQGTQTETTESFQVRIERAAVDTEASDAFFDASMNRIATKWGAYEATAEAQETARKDAESKRKDAEVSRVQAEQSRVQTEQSRVNAEQARVQVEQARADAEQERKQAEQQRKDAESKRATAEQAREQAEQARNSAESTRQSNETARQSSESTRAQAEQARQSRFNEMLDTAQNVKFRILSDSEVDSEGKPTITGAMGIIYLVKARQSQETRANHYTEWIYLEGRWELFGSTAPTAEAIELDDIDKLAQGTTIAGNRVLNATGLNALWSKLQARMQSVDSIASEAKRTSSSNASSLQALSSKQQTFEEQASKQLKALRTWAESTLETKMQERYNAGFSSGTQRGGEECERALLDCKVNDFVHMVERKSANDVSALISKLSKETKIRLLDKDPERLMSCILPDYGQVFFNGLEGADYYWRLELYCRMDNPRTRELFAKHYSPSEAAKTIARKKAAFYAHFDKSKISEIAKNPSILLSLSKDDFENACYAYVCDGTANLTINGAFHEICEKMNFPSCEVVSDSFGYKSVKNRDHYSDSTRFDVRGNRAYPIEKWEINIVGRPDQWSNPAKKHIGIYPVNDSWHKTNNYSIVTDTQCTIILEPFKIYDLD